MPVAEGGWGVMVMAQSANRDKAMPFLTWLAQDPQVGAKWNGYLACRAAPRPGQLDGYQECQGPDWEGSRRVMRLQKQRPSRFIGWESGGTAVGRRLLHLHACPTKKPGVRRAFVSRWRLLDAAVSRRVPTGPTCRTPACNR